jgi:hypothetical protein
MLRFYRKHYAALRSPVVNWAVYAGIGAKLAFSVARNALRGDAGVPRTKRGRPIESSL